MQLQCINEENVKYALYYVYHVACIVRTYEAMIEAGNYAVIVDCSNEWCALCGRAGQLQASVSRCGVVCHGVVQGGPGHTSGPRGNSDHVKNVQK